jgi:hypothetical protein
MSSNQVDNAPSTMSTQMPNSLPSAPTPSTQAQVVVMGTRESRQGSSPLRTIYSIFHMVVAIFALYLSFKCNKGFDIGAFLMACCCPYIYIIYKFATSEDFCGIKSSGNSSE